MMMDICKWFSSSKKSNLSDKARKTIDPKKPKKATSSSNYSDHNVFEEVLDSSSCRSILFDCLKYLEHKLNKIFENTNTLKENQIKGEKELTDLAETVNFLSSNFDKFEANRELKQNIRKHKYLETEYSKTQISWKRTKLKVRRNSQIWLKQLIFFHKYLINLKPIRSSKKK